MTVMLAYANLAVTATHVIQKILTAFQCTVDLQTTLVQSCADCAVTLLVVLAMLAPAPHVGHVGVLLLMTIAPHVGRQLN